MFYVSKNTEEIHSSNVEEKKLKLRNLYILVQSWIQMETADSRRAAVGELEKIINCKGLSLEITTKIIIHSIVFLITM